MASRQAGRKRRARYDETAWRGEGRYTSKSVLRDRQRRDDAKGADEQRREQRRDERERGGLP